MIKITGIGWLKNNPNGDIYYQANWTMLWVLTGIRRMILTPHKVERFIRESA